MRIRLAGALALVVVLLTGCTAWTGDQNLDRVALERKAAELTDLLAGNDWARVRADFDRTMRESLTEEGLARGWKQVTRQHGAYRSRGEPTQIPKPGDFLVFDTPMQFERGDMKSRVTFRENGDVAGLFILIPTAD